MNSLNLYKKGNDALNDGAIRMMIVHEMTHGFDAQELRAKDMALNAAGMATASILILMKALVKYIIPQDTGALLLNLYNHAFYACTECS